MIAIEFADDLDHAIQRLQVARHHLRVGDRHRVVQPADLQRNEATRRIDVAARQHLGDELSHPTGREVLGKRDLGDREARRQAIEDAQLALGVGAAERPTERRRRRLDLAGWLEGLGHAAGLRSEEER